MTTMKTNNTPHRTRLFTESEATSIEPAETEDTTLSMSEYRILNPQTAEVPTLTQSRVLAALLDRVRAREARLAKRAALRAKMMAAVLHPWQTLVAAFHHQPQPALARVRRPALPAQATGAVRVTSPYLALPRA